MRNLRLRRPLSAALVLLLLGAATASASTFSRLRLAEPTGSHTVGRQITVVQDEARDEPATADTHDRRHVRLTAWYPAQPGTGRPAAYVEDLERIRDTLIASGSVGPFEAAGLALVHDPARADATVAPTETPLPVLILSPGNATNVEFYAALAEDLASHGYVVIGLDHPGQSAAVQLDHRIAPYAGDPPRDEAEATVRLRIAERAADIRFVVDRLTTDGAGFTQLAGRIDVERIGVLGHSNGGLAAVSVCDDPEIRACANIDGQQAGGPFGIDPSAQPPENPFLFLTKETTLHPMLAERFQSAGRSAFRVVVPAATHQAFTDGPAFSPRLLPLDGPAEAVAAVTRGFTRAFFDHVLRGAPRTVFGTVDAPTDVLVVEYPVYVGSE